MSDIVYEENEIIFKKGDPSEYAYVIKSGKVEIIDNYPESPIRLGLLQDGDIFGEMGLIDERPRSLTARAITETRVSKISRNDFVELMLKQPEQAFQYLRMFFERLRAMNMRIANSEHVPKSDQVPKRERKSQITPQDFTVRVTPLSPKAEKVIAPEGIEISRFPYRVGRRSSGRTDPLEVNDLLIPDVSPFNVSRNHFSIEKDNKAISISDRGSFLGTVVNGNVIGGNHKGASTVLNFGENEVIVGAMNSPYRFCVEVLTT